MYQKTELANLMLRDYRPKPSLRLSTHNPTCFPSPAIDVHNHLGRFHSNAGQWSTTDVAALVATMDYCNVSQIVNLDGGWDAELNDNIVRYDESHPGRFVTFARLDWGECSTPDWGQRLARSIRESARRGAGGVKIWKDLGLLVRDENDSLVFLDDPRLEPVWEAIAEAGLPVLVHTADPVAFFEPLDPYNERLEELLEHPDWHVYGGAFPSFAQLIDALERTVVNHPQVTFIGAHVGCYAEDLSWVGSALRSYSNFNVEIGGRIAELGRQPRAARRLVLEYPTRILLGTDTFPPTREAYGTYARFLTTEDEYFPYSSFTPPETGRWAISGLYLPQAALSGVLADNARRLIPRLRD